MKTYELTYIIASEISSEEAEAKAREIESAVQSNEGIILKQINPNARTLAYPIKKSASGFLGVLEFEMEPEKISELQSALLKDEKILRQMTVVKNPIKAWKKSKTRTKPAKVFEAGKETAKSKDAEIAKNGAKGKVELKDIEQKLDELLGE